MSVAYGCCVGSWEKFGRYVAPWIQGKPMHATSGWSGIVSAYNMIMDNVSGECRSPSPELQALILMHDDLEILDPDAEAKFVAALAMPDVELVGVAGGGGDSIYWWNHNPIGHQRTDQRLIDFGPRAGDVTLIEGSIMALSPWLIRNLRFDPRFTGWHGYDEIGMHVHAEGKRVAVIDVDTHHHNPEGYRSAESAAECVEANRLYQKKWGFG